MKTPRLPTPVERPIPVPVRGMHEGMSGAAQPEGTYAAGCNVRSRAEDSEEVGITRRTGLTAVISALGGRPRAMFLGSRETPPFLWRELTTSPQSGVVPTVVTRRDTEETLATPLGAPLLDDWGSIYIQRIDGAVEIHNAELALVETIPSPIPISFTPVASFGLDETGAVYLAGTRSTPLDGGAGRVARMRKVNDRWAVHWIQVVEHPIAAICYTANGLYLALEPAPDPSNFDLIEPAALLRLAQAQSALPIAAWERPIPRPVLHLAPVDDGSVLVSSPANGARNTASTTGFTARNVGWTPRELADWTERVYAWIDTLSAHKQGQAYADGDDVTLLQDERVFPSDYGSIDANAVKRELRQSIDWPAPIYDERAFGETGGVRFVSGSLLMSEATLGTDPEDQRGLIPGDGDEFAVCMVIRIPETAVSTSGSTARRLLVQQTDEVGGQRTYRFDVVNSTYHIREQGTSKASIVNGVGLRTAIISFWHKGAGTPGVFRLNGAGINTTNLADPTQGGPYIAGEPTATNAVDAPGPVSVLGAAVNPTGYVNLLLNPDADLSITHLYAGYNTNTQSIRDGNRELSPLVTNQGYPELQVYSGSVITLDWTYVELFDSITVYFSSRFWRLPTRMKVEVASDSAFTTALAEWEFAIEIEPSGFKGVTRRQFRLGTQYARRYVRIEFTEWDRPGAKQSEIVELEFHNQTPNGSGGTDQQEFWLGELLVIRDPDLTTIESIEGYLAHKRGVAHTLDAAHPWTGANNFEAGDGDPRITRRYEPVLNSRLPIVARIASSGELLYARDGAGVGYGAVQGAGNAVFTVGDPFPSTGGSGTTNEWGAWLRRWYDRGTDLDDTHASAWEVDAATADEAPRAFPFAIGVDDANDLYLARVQADDTRTLERRAGETGALIFAQTPTDDRRPLAFLPEIVSPLVNPGDVGTSGVRTVYALVEDTADALQAWTILGQERSGATRPRELEILCVRGSDLVRVLLSGTLTTVSSGAFLDDELWTASAFGVTFIGGAAGYKVYDHKFRTLRDFRGSTKGRIPERCELGAFFNGRLWLAGGDDPYGWGMARLADPYDWNDRPEAVDEAMPVSSGSSPLGPVPDIVRCLMPWTTDVAYEGCERSLYRIEGNPASDGRRIFVADIGVAKGQGSYCLDHIGNLYFMAAHGDVMRIRVGQGYPESLTDNRIGARLRDTDFQIYRPVLVWSKAESALHVFLVPRATALSGSLPQATVHWVWQAQFDAWHPTIYPGGPERVVTAALPFDGDDPGDRTVLVGFAGGAIGQIDRYADSDMGTPIPWHVTMGPLRDRGLAMRLRATHGSVVTRGEGEFRLGAFGAEQWPLDSTGFPDMHRMVAGQTGRFRPTASGAMLFVTAMGHDPVTLQALSLGVVPAGRTGR